MDKQKIIKIGLIILSIMFFLFLLTSSMKKAILEVSEKANSSVQIFASEHAQVVFNNEVFREYRICKKRVKNEKKIKNYIEYCGFVLDEAAIPDDGYLNKISRKYYHYNWMSGTYATRYGRIVYKLTDKDKYLKPLQCWLMLLNKFLASFFTSFLLTVGFYFTLKLINILLKSTLGRIFLGVLIAIILGVGFMYKFHTVGGDGGGDLALHGTKIASSGDVPVLLKVLITTLAALIAYKEFKVCKYSLWTIGFLLIAFIYNPLIPVIQLLSSVGLVHWVNILGEIFFISYLIKEYKNSVQD